MEAALLFTDNTTMVKQSLSPKTRNFDQGAMHPAGKSLRQKCPPLSHGKVIFLAGEKRDFFALIKSSNADRLSFEWDLKRLPRAWSSRRVGADSGRLKQGK
jgi:hypothetical protein